MKGRRVRHQKTRGGKNGREAQSVASRRDNADQQDMAAESEHTQTHRHKHTHIASVLIFTSQIHRHTLLTPFTLWRTHTLVLQACCPVSQSIKVRSVRHVLPRSPSTSTLPKKKRWWKEGVPGQSLPFAPLLSCLLFHRISIYPSIFSSCSFVGGIIFSALLGGRSLKRVSQMNQ